MQFYDCLSVYQLSTGFCVGFSLYNTKCVAFFFQNTPKCVWRPGSARTC